MRLLERRDVDLDKLSTANKRIGTLEHDKHEKLGHQASSLNDLGGTFNGDDERLKLKQNKIRAVMEQAGCRQSYTIARLIITFLLFTFLVCSHAQ